MQQISNLLNDETYVRMMGIDDKRPGSCETHGDFIEMHCSGERRGAPKGWKGCPTCAEEAMKASQEQEERERQAKFYQDRIERMIAGSDIPQRFTGKSFDDFREVNPKARSHLKSVRQYAELIASGDHQGRCLILLGTVGNGKTHLACALVERVIRATGRPCKYSSFSEIIRDVKGSFSKTADYTEEDVYRNAVKPLLAVIDEVGMQNFTDFEQAVAYEVINARYLAELPTVVVTNLQAKDLPLCVGERVVDRLREGGGKALDFDWKSYRLGGEK